MLSRARLLAVAVLLVLPAAGATFFNLTAGVDMTGAANRFLATLDDSERQITVLAYDSPLHVDWHFIPKDERKGLQIKHMSQPQRGAALSLLRSCLSEVGYDKATKIMQLEKILHELEKGREGGNIRDTERYYVTVFGQPAEKGRWGLSIEGHHLSLNFVVEDGEIISSTPTFFAANPAIVKSDIDGGLPVGTRVLADEEVLAFELVNSLDAEQRAKAIIADKAPREIRAAGEPQPPQEEAVGIRVAELTDEQHQLARRLASAYLSNLPEEVRQARMEAIRAATVDKIRFAWAGATKPGVGHYYRIQGPTFLIEFVNTQPDPAGNPANHIHCVWRDMRGDFALSAN